MEDRYARNRVLIYDVYMETQPHIFSNILYVSYIVYIVCIGYSAVCWLHTIELWAGLTHAPQLCCFSLVWDVLSMFRVYSLNY